MKLAFAMLLLVHGLVHSMGFLKAFGLARLPQLGLPISRPRGVLWLVAGLAMLGTAVEHDLTGEGVAGIVEDLGKNNLVGQALAGTEEFAQLGIFRQQMLGLLQQLRIPRPLRMHFPVLRLQLGYR